MSTRSTKRSGAGNKGSHWDCEEASGSCDLLGSCRVAGFVQPQGMVKQFWHVLLDVVSHPDGQGIAWREDIDAHPFGAVD